MHSGISACNDSNLPSKIWKLRGIEAGHSEIYFAWSVGAVSARDFVSLYLLYIVLYVLSIFKMDCHVNNIPLFTLINILGSQVNPRLGIDTTRMLFCRTTIKNRCRARVRSYQYPGAKRTGALVPYPNHVSVPDEGRVGFRCTIAMVP